MLVCFFQITALLSYSLPFKGFLNSSFVYIQGFPDGSAGKELPANAGDKACIPDLGRSHMPWSNEVHAPQLLSLCSIAWQPQLLSPRAAPTEAQGP